MFALFGLGLTEIVALLVFAAVVLSAAAFGIAVFAIRVLRSNKSNPRPDN